MIAFVPVRAWSVFAVVAAVGSLLVVLRYVLARRVAASSPAS
jgi:hypothetical protein